MKEIETLVEEKTKESLDVSRLTREGERIELWVPLVVVMGPTRQHPPVHSSPWASLNVFSRCLDLPLPGGPS
jgi:hypothetical protein